MSGYIFNAASCVEVNWMQPARRHLTMSSLGGGKAGGVAGRPRLSSAGQEPRCNSHCPWELHLGRLLTCNIVHVENVREVGLSQEVETKESGSVLLGSLLSRESVFADALRHG